ncbi:MAG: leucine-rich repeat domain-containing protein [Sedimentisphaerales bacterium]|nr:leucine-rich repeat domain-containing protein [Sedimentisphaerales bacterium]
MYRFVIGIILLSIILTVNSFGKGVPDFEDLALWTDSWLHGQWNDEVLFSANADSTTGQGGFGCYGDLPPMELVLTGTEEAEIVLTSPQREARIKIYHLSVTNWAAFDELFGPPCPQSDCPHAGMTPNFGFPISSGWNLQVAEEFGLITKLESASDLTRLWYWNFAHVEETTLHLRLGDPRCDYPDSLAFSQSNSVWITGTAPRRFLTLSSSIGGHVSTPGEGTFEYDALTFVRLAAQPDPGYQFYGWLCPVWPPRGWQGDWWKVVDGTSAMTWAWLDMLDEGYELVANFEPDSTGQLRVQCQSKGFSLDIPKGRSWSDTADLMLDVQVLDGNGRFVYMATISTSDGVALGQNNAGPAPNCIFPITDAPVVGPCVKSLVATLGNAWGTSVPITFYTITAEDAFTEVLSSARAEQINSARQWRAVADPSIPAPNPVLDRLMLVWTMLKPMLEYFALPGDEITLGTFEYTVPGVEPVYRVYEGISRNGSVIHEWDCWTTDQYDAYYIKSGGTYTLGPDTGSPDIVVTVASPATIYITDPRGLHAGCDPRNGQLVVEFPVFMSDPNAEPFHVRVLDPIDGSYNIQVVPKPGAEPSATYTLTATIGEQSLTLAENAKIGLASSVSYHIDAESSPSGIFKDANLKARVEATLGVTDPTPADMLGLTSLVATCSVCDLTGLQYATNLKELLLSMNFAIGDLSPLSGLRKLTRLDLEYNGIINITLLSGLTDLKSLYLGNNSIQEIGPLEGLANLQILSLEENQISDIQALANLRHLQHLNLTGNPLSAEARDTYIPEIIANNPGIDLQIGPASVHFPDPNLKAAVEVALDVNEPTPLDMLQLTELTARESSISTLSGLEYAINLTELDLGWNSIDDLSPLAGLSNLRLLHMDNNVISDISPLSALTALEALWLDSNQIEDISALAGLMNLQWLDLSRNPLNQEACDVYIPQIKSNNPGVQVYETSCAAECTLTVSSTTGGWVYAVQSGLMKPVSGTLNYSCDTRVLVSAKPDLDHHFVNWTGTAVTAGKVDNPNSSITTVTVDADYTLVANFAPEEPEPLYPLGIAIIPSGAGSVTCSPDQSEYPLGEKVTVTATPASGYVFSHWSGITQVDDPFSATTWLFIEEACHVIAIFEPTE